MVLENAPEEIPRLRRYEKLFEVLTWTVIATAYLFSWLPLGLPINRLGVHLVILTASLSAVIFYRIAPFEKRTGRIKYTFKFKGFLIGLANPLLISAYIVFTGGVLSPFFYIYYLPIVSATIYLPLAAVLTEYFEITILYILSTIILAPLAGAATPADLTLSLIPINITAVGLLIGLSFFQSTEVAKESASVRELAAKSSVQSAAIQTERNTLKVVLSGIRDGVFALDRQRRVIFFNQAAEKITSFAESEVLGKPVDEVLQIYQHTDRVTAEKFCPLDGPPIDRTVFAQNNLRITGKYKKPIFVNLSSATIKEGPQANIGCIVTFQDITHEHQLEEMKLDFVSMAAHELRTPITAIRGYIAFLADELVGKLSGDQEMYVERTKLSANQLAALIENLLNVSRIERGALKLELAAVDWVKLVESIVAEFQELADQKKLKLVSEKPNKSLPKVAVDAFRISEVLANLLSNAINFTQKGQVTVKVLAKGNFIQTSVADTGPGIPAEAVPNLFTKFFRVSGILEQGSKGTGLGLFIAKSIVNLHGGEIWVDTRVGVGSTFSFTVPVFAGKPAEAAKPALAPKPRSLAA